MSERIVNYYKALSNPIRLKVFLHVAEKSEGKAPRLKKDTCVCEISSALGIPQPTASNHLKILEQAGLIHSVKVGTRCYQYVTKRAAEDLMKHTNYIYAQAHKNPY